ncbi:hypothetical protein SL267_22130 [Serratia marcescens]|nr:hypothetical protein SL267_22130 [Serratia marcescens]
MTEAARVGDIIGHSHALAGMIAGTIVGGDRAAGALAAGALFVAGPAASCIGAGAWLLIGASLAVGYLTGEAATAARDGIADAGAGSLTPKAISSPAPPTSSSTANPPRSPPTARWPAATTARACRWRRAPTSVSINGQLASRVGTKPTATRR